MIKLRQLNKKFKQLLCNYIEDFLIFTGILLITIATFMINIIAGLYVLGGILLVLGVYFAKYPLKRR